MKKRIVWRQVRTLRDAPLVFTKHLLLGYSPNKAIDTERDPQLDISLTSTRTSLVWETQISPLGRESWEPLSPLITLSPGNPTVSLTVIELDDTD